MRAIRALSKMKVARAVAVPALSASAAVGFVFSAGTASSSGASALSTSAAAYEGSYPYKASPARLEAGKPLSLPKPQVIFVLGGPGAGKGTQCTRLVKEYGYVHLSAGDLLREERQRGGPEAEMIESYIREGKIVPVEVTVNLIRKAMEKAAPAGGGHFLVDGFPRNFDNLEGWTRVMGEKAEVQGVLFYECPEAVMEKRLIKRGETSGRSDDTADVIRKRFHTYLQSTMPVVNHYAAQGKVFSVNSDQGVDEVFAQTQTLLEPLLAAEVSKCHQLLLDSVHHGDWELYTALSSPELTAIEAESNGEVVKGLDFHRFYFDAAANKRRAAVAAAAAAGQPAPVRSQSILAPGAEVRLLSGKTALVTGNRLVQREGRTDTVAETRLWKFNDKTGLWQQQHFHRSPAALGDAAAKST